MARLALTASSLLQKLTNPQFRLRALSSSVRGHMILIEYTLPKGENASWKTKKREGGRGWGRRGGRRVSSEWGRFGAIQGEGEGQRDV